jgi:hypothetical protein
MLNLHELKRASLEADLRRQRIAESVAYTEALEQAEKAARDADAKAAGSEEAAKQKEADAARENDPNRQAALLNDAEALRRKAIADRKAAEETRRQAEDARLKAEFYQEQALAAEGSAHDDFWKKLANGLTSLNMWVWVVLFGTLLFLVGGIMARDSLLLSALGRSENARALITLLIIGTTVSLAVMLVYQSYSPKTTNENFRMAREIFSSLIGIVGTIVGFYFGAMTRDNPEAASLPSTNQSVRAVPSVSAALGANAIRVTVANARLPFTWRIFEPENPNTTLSSGTNQTERSFSIPREESWKGRRLNLAVKDGLNQEAAPVEIIVP